MGIEVSAGNECDNPAKCSLPAFLASVALGRMVAMLRSTPSVRGIDLRNGRSARRVITLLASVFGLVWTASIRADQGGVPFWVSGQYASLAATPDSPGWSLSNSLNFDSGSASASRSFTIGTTLTAGLKTQSTVLTLQPTYTPVAPVLGGSISFGLGFGGGYNSVAVQASSSFGGRRLRQSDALWGFSDPAPIVTLTWSKGNNNGMTYLTGNIPVGTYSSTRLAAIGIGHGAIDAGAGYTYQNTKSGFEFSIVAGLTGNFENQSTQYKNGIDSHVDFAASYAVAPNAQVGLAGYVYYQLTGDTGSGAKLGGFLSKVGGIGPEIDWSFKVGRQRWSANLRGYCEYWSEHRPRGGTGFFTLGIPLSAPPKSRK